MNDDALISAIQNDPYKVEIELSSMPNKSQDTINNDYFDHFAYMAQLSTDHGYQVTLGDESFYYGDVKEVYFTKIGVNMVQEVVKTEADIKENVSTLYTRYHSHFQMALATLLTVEKNTVQH
jgi:hypothetical protein